MLLVGVTTSPYSLSFCPITDMWSVKLLVWLCHHITGGPFSTCQCRWNTPQLHFEEFSFFCPVTDMWPDKLLVWLRHHFTVGLFQTFLRSMWISRPTKRCTQRPPLSPGPTQSCTQGLCDYVSPYHLYYPNNYALLSQFTNISLLSRWGLLFFTPSAIKLSLKSILQPIQLQGTDRQSFWPNQVLQIHIKIHATQRHG